MRADIGERKPMTMGQLSAPSRKWIPDIRRGLGASLQVGMATLPHIPGHLPTLQPSPEIQPSQLPAGSKPARRARGNKLEKRLEI